ncbi:MAG: inositol monophosphatase family protein [Magnetovibrionaceae bacterium]
MRAHANRTPLLNVMVAAAEKAARRLVRDFGEVENLQVSKKGPADFVSAADKECERTLTYELQKARPKYGLLLEEGGEIVGSDTSNRWIVDPLDGTTNFLHGLAHFCISIGLERDGELFAGVILEPVNNQLFWAEQGKGAFLNGRRIRVSARREMSESLFATGIPFLGIDHHEAFTRQLNGVMGVSAGVRRFGSAALDLAYVAAGRYEGYWENGLNPWDVAAGIVLVREAGGYVTDLSGGKGYLDGKGIIAANPTLLNPLTKIVGSK